MPIYLLFTVCIILATLSTKVNINKKLEYGMLFLFLLFQLVRFPLGTDVIHYRHFFDLMPVNFLQLFKLQGSPIPNNYGYIFSMYFVKVFTNNFSIFLFIYKLVLLILVGKIIYRYSSNALISIILFCGCGLSEVYFFNAFRQLAIMILFFYAYYEYLCKNQYIKYYLMIFLSITFHWMAMSLIFVPIIKLLFDHYFTKKIIYILPILLTLVFHVVFFYNITWIQSFMPGRFINYFVIDEFSLLGILSRLAIFIVVLQCFIFANKEKVTQFEKFGVYLCFLSLLFYIVVMRSSIFSRFSDLISVIEIVLVPNLFMKIEHKYWKKYYYAFLSIVFVNTICVIGDVQYTIDHSLIGYTYKNYPTYFLWQKIPYKELFVYDKYD